MIESVNIATLPIADKVHRHALACHYLVLLEALQSQAWALGYYSAKADTAVAMPPVLAEVLAEAVVRRREFSHSPKDSSA